MNKNVRFLSKDQAYRYMPNTSIENVIFFKSKVQNLNKIKNWITRNDYINAKPDGECYELAKQKYYKNEQLYILHLSRF